MINVGIMTNQSMMNNMNTCNTPLIISHFIFMNKSLMYKLLLLLTLI